RRQYLKIRNAAYNPRPSDLGTIRGLLQTYPIEQLEGMAIELFKIPPGFSHYFDTCDHGINVLASKAGFLAERFAARTAANRPPPCDGGHEPPCRNSVICFERHERERSDARRVDTH